MGTKKNVYETLAKVDVSKHVEKKGDATYLSWSWAWAFVKKEFEPKPQGLTVIVRNNDIQKAMRKLKRMIKDDGLLDDIKNKSHYRKPSEIKQEKRKAARARWLKKRKDIRNQLGY